MATVIKNKSHRIGLQYWQIYFLIVFLIVTISIAYSFSFLGTMVYIFFLLIMFLSVIQYLGKSVPLPHIVEDKLKEKIKKNKKTFFDIVIIKTIYYFILLLKNSQDGLNIVLNKRTALGIKFIKNKNSKTKNEKIKQAYEREYLKIHQIKQKRATLLSIVLILTVTLIMVFGVTMALFALQSHYINFVLNI